MHMHGLVPAAVSLDGYHVQHACMHSLDLVARLLGAIARTEKLMTSSLLVVVITKLLLVVCG
jgi:hypothetical protein